MASQVSRDLFTAMRAKSQLVLGIMSGTSIDGVDYALCDVSESRIRLRELWSAKFPPALQTRLRATARGSATSWEAAQLHHDLGRFYARHARRSGKSKPLLVGLHGQTVFHHPDQQAPATLQLGEPAYLTEALRVPVISNFRVADLAAGGQGAPLATMFHVRVFGKRGRHVCVNNLGGISNVTSIDWRRGNEPKLLAFDTGPANVLIDLATREVSDGRLPFDRGGKLAARGRVDEALVNEWLRHPYFWRRPPKSTGRELFGEAFFKPALRIMRQRRFSDADIVATFTALTARSLALNYWLHLSAPPELVVLAGGGALNATLRLAVETEIKKLNPGAVVQSSTELGWPVQSLEPAAFALLAWLRVRGEAGNFPETTGARRAVLLGQISEEAPLGA